MEIVTVYVFPFLSVFGIVGNVFMLLTIRYGRLHDSPYVYLKFIAMADLILSLLLMTSWLPYCKNCNFSVHTMFYLQYYFWSVLGQSSGELIERMESRSKYRENLVIFTIPDSHDMSFQVLLSRDYKCHGHLVEVADALPDN